MQTRPLTDDGRSATRLVIAGGPFTGKSTLARDLRRHTPSTPTFCGDPRSKARAPEPDVTYLPEGLPIAGGDGAAQWIATNWLSLPGPWICEGWAMARALRRWLAGHGGKPCDGVIWLDTPRVQLSKGQAAMLAGCCTVWGEIIGELARRGVDVLAFDDNAGVRRVSRPTQAPRPRI